MTPRNDPWVQERTRFLFQNAFAPLVEPFRNSRIQLLDIACGTGKTTMGLCKKAFAKQGISFDLTFVDVVPSADCIRKSFYRNARIFGSLAFRHESLFDWIDNASIAPKTRYDLIVMLRVCDVFGSFDVEEFSCDEANALARRERRACTVDVDTLNPAKLIEENTPGRLHDRLWRSSFGDGMLFHQFSLSDYFKAIKAIISGAATLREDAVYVPVRRFDEAALTLPSGRSLIGQLMMVGERLLIEDSELTPSRLRQHISRFALSGLSVTELSDHRTRYGASVAVVRKCQSREDQG